MKKINITEEQFRFAPIFDKARLYNLLKSHGHKITFIHCGPCTSPMLTMLVDGEEFCGIHSDKKDEMLAEARKSGHKAMVTATRPNGEEVRVSIPAGLKEATTKCELSPGILFCGFHADHEYIVAAIYDAHEKEDGTCIGVKYLAYKIGDLVDEREWVNGLAIGHSEESFGF